MWAAATVWVGIGAIGCSSRPFAAAPGEDGGVNGLDAAVGENGPDDGAKSATCGNGVVDPGEQCDRGTANGPGAGCEANCQWTCVAGDERTLARCPRDACFAPSSCTAEHQCAAGKPIPPGGACGDGGTMVCSPMGACVSPKCGDGIVEPWEECDRGADNGPGTGCEADCHFTCGGQSPKLHNCDSADSCTANGVCADATHICTPGAPAADGKACHTAAVTLGVCKGGQCTPPQCGDGVVEPGEDCDLGADNGAGAGCETDCRFSCRTLGDASTCTQPGDACGGTRTCAAVWVAGHADPGQRCTDGAPLADGAACHHGGTAGQCHGGMCVTPTCGDGRLDPGEECDFGTSQNGRGLGCRANCLFECEKSPIDTCADGIDPCTPSPKVCSSVTAPYGTKLGQSCEAAMPLAVCGSCGSAGQVCARIPGNKCAPPRCGDGCVEPGETCDPPGPTCGPTCLTIVCGNGVREGDEQCDDGNTQNLDGCSATCRFEQIHRATSIAIDFSTTGVPCGRNVLGGAMGALAQGIVQAPLSEHIARGKTNLLFSFEGISDLTGENQTTGLSLGAFAGLPPAYASGADGTAGKDVDGWYVVNPATIVTDAHGHYQPASMVPAMFQGGMLSARGDVDLVVAFTSDAPSRVHLSRAQLSAATGPTSLPAAAGSTMASPGHLASEHLDPALTSFATTSGGWLCGNVDAASLAKMPLTDTMRQACGAPPEASLLDVVVGGCLPRLGGVSPTLPDSSDPAKPMWGAGPPYRLTESGKRVTACKDAAGATTSSPAELATCLASAAYSAYFSFTSDRAIARNR